MKILHIISYPRSGSTMLGLTFGQYKETTYLGEVSTLFRYSWNRSCGCSTHSPIHVFQCPLWGPILQKSEKILKKYDLWDYTNPGVPKKVRPYFLRVALKQLKTNKPGPELKAIQEIINIVFQEASSSQNANVVVDSSKDLHYFQIIRHFYETKHIPLHLIRDVRGVVFSARRSPSFSSGRPLTFWRSCRIAVGWCAKNILIERHINNKHDSFKLLYEAWAQDPKSTTNDIITEVKGTKPTFSPFIDNTKLNIEPSHSFGGNRSGKFSGTSEIRSDFAWKKRLDKNHLLASTFSALPFLKKYGYPIF